MKRLIGVVFGLTLLVACSSTADPPSPSSTGSPTPATGATGGEPTGSSGPTGVASPTGTTVDAEGWTPEEVEDAVAYMADGIRHRNPLDLRLAAAQCAIDRIQDPAEVERNTRKVLRGFPGVEADPTDFDTYDTWHRIWVEDHDNAPAEDLVGYFVIVNILGGCEIEVGI
jgi:hypothetical protein